MSRYIGCFTVICALTLLVAGLVFAEEQEKPKEPAAAIVNGERIPMSALDKEMQVMMARNPELR